MSFLWAGLATRRIRPRMISCNCHATLSINNPTDSKANRAQMCPTRG
jgi:hypothetical protein